jgi:two-component system, cell cycle sensor histidine kinase and response regulator CckA
MKILHLEDNANDAELIRRLIAAEWPAAQITCVDNAPAYVRELQPGRFDVILSDCALPGFDGYEALRLAKTSAPDTPFIFVSGTLGEERAIEAVRLGAEDYVLKDAMKRLITAITRCIREAEERSRRRQAEMRIQELGDCLNQAREAVIVTDLDGRITFWNQGAEQLSGWSAAEALERTGDQLFDAETALRVSTVCRRAIDEGEWLGELELRDRSGKWRSVQLRITVIRDDAGRPKARLVLGTDVTDRRVAERRVREQAEMLNQAREAIFITDLNGRIIYWNAGAERLLGWPTAEAMGKTAEQMMEPALLGAIQAARDQTLEHGQWYGELRMQNRNREPLVVESRQTLIRDEAGRPKARLCINSDITERKRLEQQFLRAQRMENLGLLAAGIAHDLNNMLAPILLAAPMLREYVMDEPPLRLLDTLEKSAERGSLLVRQILGFAHGATGENHLLQVKHLLRDIVAVVAGTFPKSIRLEDYVPSDLWAIKGNPTQIHQVLLNLCVNARDAMPNGGTLRVIAENKIFDAEAAADVAGARPGAFLVLRVEDTGTGIPPEILQRIWEPFFTTKEADRGTGLGLSTVRGIVEAHHGFVTVNSAIGEGTCFHVYLPAAECELPESVQTPLRLLPQGKGELILVVDDEAEIREMTSEILGRYGYSVLLASDGAEAAAMFAQRATEIRLVISDLHMPNLDGATLARALRRINPEAKMLVVSGMASGLGSRIEMRPEEFADAVLLKPFKAETLLEQVHELLEDKPLEIAGEAAPALEL